MARTAQQILEAQLGALHMQLAQMQARIEQLTEENQTLKTPPAPPSV